MNSTYKKRESGQILVFVVLFVIGLFAMLALVLDGGNTYSKRRAAQNAADAGALAGARTLCMTKSSTQAVAVAQDYATSKNEADTATVNIDGDGYVTVTTRITFDTFFAHLIGRPQMTAEAQAVAGCFPPTSGSLLPVAWACKSPGPGDPFDCDEKVVTDEQLEYYITQPTPPVPPASDPFHTTIITGTIWPELYVIMDALKTDEDPSIPICESVGGPLDCDINNDNEDDLVVGGDRSWLDLDGGGGGASQLVNWINGGGVQVEFPFWTDGKSGVNTSVYTAVNDQLIMNKNYFTIPVFNAVCSNYPPVECPSLYPDDPFYNTAVGPTYFHVVGTVYFYVSCVSEQSLGHTCPGNQAAIDTINTFFNDYPDDAKALGITHEINKINSIEGYFVNGIPQSASGGNSNGLDTGVYTLKLYK